MRPLSFFFAALLGIVLAMMAPALAGPRPQAPVLEPALEVAIPQPAQEAAVEEAPALELDLASTAIDAADTGAGADNAEISVEEITRSLLEVLGAADAA